MAERYLDTYLNDHLAGSVAAIELLGRLEQLYGANSAARLVAATCREIEEDRQTLRALMGRLGIAESTSRRIAGAAAGQLLRLKTSFDDPSSDGRFRLFEGLEVLVLGIDGKRLLWRALEHLAQSDPGLSLDYDRLVARAEDQRRRMESLRMEAVRTTFAEQTTPSGAATAINPGTHPA